MANRHQDDRAAQKERAEEEARFQLIAQDVGKRQRSRVRTTHIRDVLSRVASKRGIAERQTDADLNKAWSAAVSKTLASRSVAKAIRQSVLQVEVTTAVVAQEIAFGKSSILKKLRKLLPNVRIDDIRCQTGGTGKLKVNR